jgi:predicted transcriptional regulator
LLLWVIRQPAFVADFWNFNFYVSDLPAIAETSRNSHKKQEITVSDADIIKQADCSMMEFRTRLREKCGLTERNTRKVIDEFIQSGKLAKHKSPGSKETIIATPERVEQLKLDWRN